LNAIEADTESETPAEASADVSMDSVGKIAEDGIAARKIGNTIDTCAQDRATVETDLSGDVGLSMPTGKAAARSA
jgi:hypothetical protein